jgi:hypothetical protein
MEATVDGDTYTATATTVKDFYRWRRLFTNKLPTSNSGNFIITDADCANVDGSGNDIYGLITVGFYEQLRARYMVPAGYSAWVAKWSAQAAKSADNDSYTFQINYTRKGAAYARTEIYEFIEKASNSTPLLLEEGSEVIFSITDLETADKISGEIVIVEVKNY